MDLNKAMHAKHDELIRVANEQEQLAIKAVQEQYMVMRLGIDASFGIERATVKALDIPDATELGTDDDVPMTAQSTALGATS